MRTFLTGSSAPSARRALRAPLRGDPRAPGLRPFAHPRPLRATGTQEGAPMSVRKTPTPRTCGTRPPIQRSPLPQVPL